MRGLICLLVLTLAQAAPATGSAAEKIVVGYREDARPFAYLDKPDSLIFKGFIADLCSRALDLAGYQVERVPVDAKSRWRKLDNREIDMLCDTTSVSLDRASEHLFSPIIFLSGVSYAYSPKAEQDSLAAYSDAQGAAAPQSAERGGTENADPAEAAPFCAGQPADLGPQLEPSRVPVLRVGVLNATTADTAVRKAETMELFRLKPGEAICIVSVVGSYAEGIGKLCRGEFAFFFGDRDMLQTYLTEELKQPSGCDAILSGKFFSYEPYALIVNSERRDLALKLQSALFHLFSNGEAEKLFEDYFEGSTKSDLLQALFRINAIGRVE